MDYLHDVLELLDLIIREMFRVPVFAIFMGGFVMAAALGVSRSYLSTYYKNKTGINLSDSIQMYRVEKAMELLGDPTIRTGDVGEMVGFTGKNTYLRQFKKYTGMTPKEYQTKTNGTPV